MARRIALLIGNQRFDDGSGFEPLRGPHNDVDALAHVLGDPARGGFEPVEVLKDAPLRTLARSLRQFLRTAARSDEVLIHYSGHGQPDEDGRLFFAASDSHAEELAATALRASDLQEWMALSAAGSVVLFLDCCFAGAFGKVLTGGLRGAQETSIQQQLRAAAQAASGRFILASATSWQTAQETEDEGDGIWMGRFTRAVLGRLETAGSDAGGEVRFSHLAASLRGAFPGHDPRAFVADGAGDPLIARRPPRETPEQRRIRLLTTWLDSKSLPTDLYASAVEAVHGEGPEALVRRVADLLDTPGVTPRVFAAAFGVSAPDTGAGGRPALLGAVETTPPKPEGIDLPAGPAPVSLGRQTLRVDDLKGLHAFGPDASTSQPDAMPATDSEPRPSHREPAPPLLEPPSPPVRPRRPLMPPLSIAAGGLAVVGAVFAFSGASERVRDLFRPIPPIKPVAIPDSPKPPLEIPSAGAVGTVTPANGAATPATVPNEPAAAITGRRALPPPGTVIRDCDDVCPQMVVIPGGSFDMGAPPAEVRADPNERPQRRVTVPSIAVGKFEVTFAEWDACVAAGGCRGYRPSDNGWGRGDRPVVNVSWDDAQAYVAWLNERTRARRGTATYRLLTEAEWEYACRAGTTTPFSFGSTISTAQANYDGSAPPYGSGTRGENRRQTVPVAAVPANAWGLHQMHGNVWEWVHDTYGPYTAWQTDAGATTAGPNPRVLRGGSWGNPSEYLRCSARIRYEPAIRDIIVGFRVARTLF